MSDVFTPLDELNKLAPYNILTMLAGGQQFELAGEIKQGEVGYPVGLAVKAPAGPASVPPMAEVVFPAVVNVKVTDKETKLPVAGAAVYYGDTPIGLTDSKGKLTARDIPKGEYILSVDAIGYDVAEKNISIPGYSRSPQTFNYDFELSYIEMLEEGVAEEVVTPPTPPTYEYPSYPSYGAGAPTYEAPSYGGPTYGAPPAAAQPAFPALPALPQLPGPPTAEYLQQFLLLPFTTIQTALGMTPMARGGRCRR